MSVRPWNTAANGALIAGDYRYLLWRRWSTSRRICNFVMLNPSTADETENDPTIRRCMAFAKSWGYGVLVVTNLFAHRATEPKDMLAASDPVGPENGSIVDEVMDYATHNDGLIVAAWGNKGSHMDQAEWFKGRAEMMDAPVRCFEISKKGQPKHPLYQPSDKELIWYSKPTDYQYRP